MSLLLVILVASKEVFFLVSFEDPEQIDKLLPLPQPPVRARTEARRHGQIQAPREPPN
jgi:hypothetical protein